MSSFFDELPDWATSYGAIDGHTVASIENSVEFNANLNVAPVTDMPRKLASRLSSLNNAQQWKEYQRFLLQCLSSIGKDPEACSQFLDYCIDAQQCLRILQSEFSLSTSTFLKNRIADEYSKENDRIDPRFIKTFLLDAFKDLKPAFILYLYPTHFKLDNQDGVFNYDGPMKIFLDAADQQLLLPELVSLLDESNCDFYDGCAVAEIHDHRQTIRASSFFSPQNHYMDKDATTNVPKARPSYVVHRILLRPTLETLLADIDSFHISNGGFLDDEGIIKFEAEILNKIEPPLCLNSSGMVSKVANLIEFNKKKFLQHKRRRFNQEPLKNELEIDKLMTISVGKESEGDYSHKGFKLISFVDDWRKSKSNTDKIAAAGLDKSGTKNVVRRASSNGLQQLVRTVKFARRPPSKPGTPVYTCLNVYMSSDGMHEAVLRWGSAPDTSVEGQTLKFHIGDSSTTEKYVQNFQNLYCNAEQHTLIQDNRLSQEIMQSFFSSDTRQAAALIQNQANLTVAAKKRQLMMQAGVNILAAQNISAESANPHAQLANPSITGYLASNTTNTTYSSAVDSSAAKNGTSNDGLIPNINSEKLAQKNHLGLLQQQQQFQRTQNQLQRQRFLHLAHQQRLVNNVPVATNDFPPQNLSVQAVSGEKLGSAHANVPGSSSKQSNASQNMAIIQRLLRMPYQQVPEQHKALYLQLRQRLQSRNSLQSQVALSQSSGSALPQVSGVINTNPQLSMNQQAQIQQLAVQQQRQSQMQQLQMAQARQQRLQAFQNQINTQSNATAQLTPAQLNALQNQILQQQLLNSGGNLNDIKNPANQGPTNPAGLANQADDISQNQASVLKQTRQQRSAHP